MKPKTRFEIAMNALEALSKGAMDLMHVDKDKIVEAALAEIKDMPDDNCGNCVNLNRIAHTHGFCSLHNHTREQLVMDDKDFCSRFEAKEKAE